MVLGRAIYGRERCYLLRCPRFNFIYVFLGLHPSLLYFALSSQSVHFYCKIKTGSPNKWNYLF